MDSNGFNSQQCLICYFVPFKRRLFKLYLTKTQTKQNTKSLRNQENFRLVKFVAVKRRIKNPGEMICCSTKAYQEPCQTSKMKRFVKIVYGFQPLTIFTRHSMLDV